LEKNYRLKVTNVLKENRINLLKFIVNQNNCEIESPEVQKTFRFSKYMKDDPQLKYLYFHQVCGDHQDVPPSDRSPRSSSAET